jgi:hypothetical protein
MLRIAAVKFLIGRSCEYRSAAPTFFLAIFPSKKCSFHKQAEFLRRYGSASSHNQAELLRGGFKLRKKSNLQVLDGNALRVGADV